MFGTRLLAAVGPVMLAVACVRAPGTLAPTPAPGALPTGDRALASAAAAGAENGAASARARAATGPAADTVRPPAPASPKAPAETVRTDSVSAADVTRESARVFGNGAPPPPRADTAANGEPLWDIDVRSYETRARVEDYVRIFSGRVKEVFQLALQRQTRYGPMLRSRLKAAGLPEDLTYLALIESWFNPHAYSRAAAVGFWQFMAGTARGMGLRVDWWVDERRDPVRSTEAAARLLRGMRDQFGSLYLAAAAYNGGEGRVSRGLARYASALDGVEGEDRYFALADKDYLRRETKDYVPKIIAAALVGEEPQRYGVRVDSLPPYAYDSVRVPGGTPLAAVANAAGVEGAEVSELNPHILRGMTPPGDSMWVRVPVTRASGFDERFSALELDERKALSRVETKKGQSMASVAKAHGITAKQLAWFNPKAAKLKSGNLRAGQTLLVPRRDVALLARDVPNPSIERYPRRASAKRGKSTAAAAKGKGASATAKGKSAPATAKGKSTAGGRASAKSPSAGKGTAAPTKKKKAPAKKPGATAKQPAK